MRKKTIIKLWLILISTGLLAQSQYDEKPSDNIFKDSTSNNEVNQREEFICGSIFTDPRDGTTYETVLINAQCWLKENMKYMTSVSPPGNMSSNPRYYVYGYNGYDVSEAKATENYQNYGVLYNWAAANAACPPGWHLPSAAEWGTLANSLGGNAIAGGALKSTTTEPEPHPRWNEPNTGATNQTGFSAVPGGYGDNYSNYSLGSLGSWWTSTELTGSSTVSMSSSSAFLSGPVAWNVRSSSVRCMRYTGLGTYNLDLESLQPEAGTLSGSGAYAVGDSVSVEAIVNPGWEFVNWRDKFGTVLSEEANFTYIMPALNQTLRASFKEVFIFTTCGDVFTDPRDGKTYNTVLIGDQCWIAENMNYGSFGYCYGDSPSNCDIYGRLYTWSQAQSVCPEGWNLPGDEEWMVMEGILDSQYGVGDTIWDNYGWRGFDAGKNMKASTGWNNNSGVDLYNYGALPGGYRLHFTHIPYRDIGERGYWWSSTEASDNNAWIRMLQDTNDQSSRSSANKESAKSVRCIGYYPGSTDSDLHLEVNPPEAGVVTGEGNYEWFEEVDVFATPNTGWRFVNWTDQEGQIVSTDSSFVYTMPVNDVLLKANFGGFVEPCPDGSTFFDTRDSTIYNTVQIGNHCWLRENMAYLPAVVPGSTGSSTIPYFYVYGYNGYNVNEAKSTENYQTYGVLYNGLAAEYACPPGWHVPTDAEWMVLEGLVDSQYHVGDSIWETWGWRGSDVGTNLKDIDGWEDNSVLDLYGFSALPGGGNNPFGVNFFGLGTRGDWWTSTKESPTRYYTRALISSESFNEQMSRHFLAKHYAKSVRCVKESVTVVLPSVTTSQVSDVTYDRATAGGAVTDNGGWDITSRGICWNTTGSPTIEDNFTVDGDEMGAFTTSLRCLAPNTTYYVRAYATNFVGTAYGNVVTFTTSEPMPFTSCGELYVDPRDGSVYETVAIGNQCWMAENLAFLPEVSPVSEWSIEEPMYYVSGYYGTDACEAKESENYETYGALYNWVAAMSACPDGWHLPTDDGWKELEGYVDSYYGIGDPEWENTSYRGADAGRNLKSWLGWNNNSGIDLFQFSALPGGVHWGSTGSEGFWWSSTENEENDRSWVRGLHQSLNGSRRDLWHQHVGFSVRCVREHVSTSYSISLEVSPVEAGTVTGAGQYEAGEQVNISAEANPGWEFVNWTDNDGIVSEAASFVYTMPAEDVTLTANFVEEQIIELPTVQTAEVEEITHTTAQSGGNITNDGGAPVTARGVVWNTTENPTIETNEGITFDGSGTGSWVSEITDLTPATTYYVRAYATNSEGTGYGEQLSFTTLEEVPGDAINIIRGGPPETNPLAIPIQITGVNANPWASNLNQWTGNWQAPQAIYDQGEYVNNPDFWSNIEGNSNAGSTWYNSSPGNSYGILVVDLQQVRQIYNISVFQMFSDGKITHIALAGHPESGSSAPDAFDDNWSEFLPQSPIEAGTDYVYYVGDPTKFFVNTSTRYVKIMAYNDGSFGSPWYIELKGIKMYGDMPEPGLPTVSTTEVTDITFSSAVSGGNIISDGGNEITARGVVWSTTETPTVETNEGITYDGEGTGSWVSELTGLAPATTYYARAYATNSEGTAYGNQQSFTTVNPPDLELNAAGLRILSAAGLEINNPDPGETIFIEVTVYNTGGTATADDVLVQVFLDEAPDDLESYDVNNYTIAASSAFTGSIPAGSSTTLLLPWTTDEPERLVLLNAATEFAANRAQSQANSQGASEPMPVVELSYDNNMAARSLLIGTPAPGDFTILVEATAPENMQSGISYTLHGTANYSWSNNPAVLGALTTVTVNGVNYTTRTSSPNGEWSVRLNGLPEGSYPASVTVYDGYLTGVANLTLEVSPGPPTIDLRIRQMGYVSGTYRIVGETGYALTGEPVVLKALVRNDGNTGTGPFDVAFLSAEGDTIGVSGPVTLDAFSEVWVNATQAWITTEGQQTLKAYADSGDVIDETNEDNNERSCILIGTDDLPDLRPFYYRHGHEVPWNYVSGLSFNPTHPLENQPVTVSCDIYNSGTSAVPAGAAFEVSFSAGGEVFATNTIIPENDLLPGASIQTSAVWPGGDAGAVVFSFDADTENAIAELDEDNNNTSRTLVVYPMADDLGFSALTFSPMQPLPDSAVNLTATVRNIGGLPGGNGLPVEFFAGSTDPDDKIGEAILDADVAPFGGTRNVTVAWTAPATVGNYPIFAKINDASIQRILRVTNSPAPNLQVFSEDISANPPFPEYGDVVSIQTNVRNTEGSTAIDFMVHFFKDVPTGGWVELGSPVSLASLEVGSQTTVDATADIIANRAAYSIKVVLVPNPEQGDADESDNQATSSFLLADAPIADAGEDVEALVGQTVNLDGTGSTNAITYAWTLMAWPDGSTANLSGENTAQPQITPDVPGTYTVRLIVSDGTVMSLPDFVNVYAIGAPILTTAEVTGITETTATSGGNITDDGGITISARGVVWSTTENPTVGTNEGITHDGEGTGSWVSELVGLSPNTEYFVRAYATYSTGTAYGDQRSFTTLSDGLPDWEPNHYLQYNMQIIGQLQYEDGTISMNEVDMVAAFVDDECRGVISPDPNFMGILFLTVGSDYLSGETVTFKAYLADEDRIVDLQQTLVFENQLQTGSIPDPFMFTYGEDPPDVLPLQNIVIGSGENFCFEAVETIITGGDGTHFEVEPGATGFLVAGEKIIMRPGTHLKAGSEVHAFIDQAGGFCTGRFVIVAAHEGKQQELTIEEPAETGNFFRIFPNPTKGLITLELIGNNEALPVFVTVHNMMGNRIIQKDMHGMHSHVFDLTGLPPGMYLIRVSQGNETGVEKVILR